MCRLSGNSRSPNLLDLSGLVQACRVIALSIFVTSILHQSQDIRLCISNPNILAQESKGKFGVLRIYICSNTSQTLFGVHRKINKPIKDVLKKLEKLKFEVFT
jgi:hypothetical protein